MRIRPPFQTTATRICDHYMLKACLGKLTRNFPFIRTSNEKGPAICRPFFFCAFLSSCSGRRRVPSWRRFRGNRSCTGCPFPGVSARMPPGAAMQAPTGRAKTSTLRARPIERHWCASSFPLVASADGFRQACDVGYEPISPERDGQDFRNEAERPEAPLPDFLAVHHAHPAGAA